MVLQTRIAVKPSRPAWEISSAHGAGHPGLRQGRWLAVYVLLRTGSAAIRLSRYKQVPRGWHPAPAVVRGATARRGAGAWPAAPGSRGRTKHSGLPGHEGQRRPWTRCEAVAD